MKKTKTTEVNDTDTEVTTEEANEKAKTAAATTTAEEQKNEETIENKQKELLQEVEKLQSENAKLQKTVVRLQSSADKSDTYLNQLVAMKNDFESYKRRMKFNAQEAKTEGVRSVAMKLIEIADTFEIAAKHLTDENSLTAFEMVHKQFVETLHGLGVKEMDVKGKPFDHNTMNALSQMDYGEENKDKVVEVYKNGYTMDDKVLRYAEVVVGA